MKEKTLKAVTRSVISAVGTITIDEQGLIRSFDAVSERIFGYTQEQVAGQNVSILMPLPYRAEHEEYLGRYLRDGAPRVIGQGREVVGRRKDGSTFPLAVWTWAASRCLSASSWISASARPLRRNCFNTATVWRKWSQTQRLSSSRPRRTRKHHQRCTRHIEAREWQVWAGKHSLSSAERAARHSAHGRTAD